MSVAEFTAPRSPAIPRTAARAGYRADIDGLRAVAVLAVVLAHAGVTGCAGGFVGVDVFFVISGFLITRNLASAPPIGWRGLVAFYGRRTRRTLPALYLVAGATLAAGSVLLLPGEFVDLARSLLWALLFLPNIFFLNQAGYFAQAAVTKPLLHTWSLGVEEQFYLVAPLLPFVLRRFEQHGRRRALVGLFALSLAFSLGLHAVNPDAAFYLLPARLWEFLTGCLVAERVIPPVRARWLAEAVSTAALIALAVSIVAFSAATPYPTLLPCLATVALIHVGAGARSTLAGRLLGSRVPAGIGLISYSIYLWHWPLLVFARLAGLPVSPALIVGGGAGLLGLSVLSWRGVELPFRAPNSPLRRHAARILIPAPVLLGTACLAIVAWRGLPQRFAPEVVQVAGYFDYSDRREFREGRCFLTTKYGDVRRFDAAACLHKSAIAPNYLILGDSFGAHLWVGFKTVFAGANVMQATASGCKPVLTPTGQRYCTDLMRAVRERFLPQLKPLDAIILSADWSSDDADDVAAAVAFYRRFARRVIVIGGVPKHETPLPDLLARSLWQHNAQLLLDRQSATPFVLDQRFKQALPVGSYVALTEGLCPQQRCIVYGAPGVPLQFDTSHFTSEGSKLVARYVERTGLLKAPWIAGTTGSPL